MTAVFDPKSERVFITFTNLDKAIKIGLSNVTRDIGDLLVKDAKAKIRSTENKTGDVYRIGGKDGILHRSSSPGEYPANLSGLLANSVSYELKSGSDIIFGDKVESRPDVNVRAARAIRSRSSRTMNYGRVLEKGSLNRTRKGKRNPVEPRPHLLITVKNNMRNIENYVEDRIKRTIQAGVKVA